MLVMNSEVMFNLLCISLFRDCYKQWDGAKLVMRHEILGEIALGEDGGEVHIPYYGSTVKINITSDEISFEEAVDVAASLVKCLEEFDTKAKLVAAQDLTDTYNDGWNEYDEVQEDGTLKEIFNPKLTPSEFIQKLTLLAVNVTGNTFDFFYDDESMFWGHSVVVSSMDGVAFTDTFAQIMG